MYRVLILDDDSGYLDVLTRLLKRKISYLQPHIDMCDHSTQAETIVQEAVETGQPFDLFVIDYNLSEPRNGIQILLTLHKVSPDTDAIIMTGVGTWNIAKEAYQAGAALYLDKPMDGDQLEMVIRVLNQQRQLRRERDWLQVFRDIAEKVEHCYSINSAAGLITEGMLNLGYDCVRLFDVISVEGSVTIFKAIAAAGLPKDEEFVDKQFEVNVSSPFPDIISSLLVSSQEDHWAGEIISRLYKISSATAPAEWMFLMISRGGQAQALLLMERSTLKRGLREEEIHQLNLFRQLISSVFERIRLTEKEKRDHERIQIINRIGRKIAVRAAQGGLIDLLEAVRAEIGELLPVKNFVLGLIDEMGQNLEFPLLYNEGERSTVPYSGPIGEGMSGYLMANPEVLYLPEGDGLFVQEHDIVKRGFPAKCWVGIPLRVSGQPIGVLILQDYKCQYAFTPDDVVLLESVADQVAGAIQANRQAENQRREAERLRILPKASSHLMTLANQHEKWLWKTLATIATADYGFRFNRIWLFLLEAGGTRLRGVMGVGQMDLNSAKLDWERDRDRSMNYDRFIEELEHNALAPTPVEEAMRDFVIELTDHENWLGEQIRLGKRADIDEDQVEQFLPRPFTEKFKPAACAVVPMRTGEQIIGLTIVDNTFDRKPIEATALDELETFLNLGCLVRQNVRQRKNWEDLLESTFSILSQVSAKGLDEILSQVCGLAQKITGADRVTIFPLIPGTDPIDFDIEHIGRDDKQHLEKNTALERPRQNGVSAHIIRAGALVVPNIFNETTLFEGKLLSQHSFIDRERIQALIASPIREPIQNASLGVIYLNFRARQVFGKPDRLQAEFFADLAATAILNWHQFGEVRSSLQRVRARGEMTQRELNILRNVLEEALACSQKDQVVRAILNGATALLREFQTLKEFDIQLMLDEKKPASTSNESLVAVQLFRMLSDGTLSKKSGSAARTMFAISGERSRIVRQGRGIEAPVFINNVVLGILKVSSRSRSLTREHADLLQHLASAASNALDNITRQERLQEILRAAKAVTAPTQLQETLNVIVDTVSKVAQDLSALTLWYWDPEEEKFCKGPWFGVRDPDQMSIRDLKKDAVVWHVMDSSEPIWALNAREDPCLTGQFVVHEEIVSAAAFPLWAEDQKVGAMFFNYRSLHTFTEEEKVLFPLLAEIVASSIRDAELLERTRRQAEGLKIIEATDPGLSLPDVLRKILQTLISLFRDAKPCVLLYNEDNNTLNYAPPSADYYPVNHPAYSDVRSFPVHAETIFCKVARESLRQHQVISMNSSNIREDSNYLSLIDRTQSQACISLMSGNRLLGVLVLDRERPDGFDENDRLLLKAVAQRISLAIERTNQLSEIQYKNTLAFYAGWGGEYAHQIRQTTRSLRTQLYWIREHIEDPDAVLNAATRIDEEIDNLIQNGPWEHLTIQRIHLTTCLQEWVEEISKKHVGVHADFYSEIPDQTIQTDPYLLKQAIQHLIRNAVHAMITGTIIVRVKQIDDQQFQIQIEDNGPGIDEAIYPLVFKESIRSLDSKRRGFGLLLVRQHVEALGGKVRLLSPVGKSAVFGIQLPVLFQLPDEDAL